MILTPKQTVALDFLEDNTTNELLYGGAAGGGKSVLMCYWQMKKRLQYPETRGFLGRNELKNLKMTTLNTFFRVAKMQGLQAGVHFKYHEQKSAIKFYNDSEIILGELKYYPSDPEYQYLGSLEITDAGIDEAGESNEKAYNILQSRCRYMLDEYDLIPKIMLGANPAKNYLYTRFYKPSKDKELPDTRKFVQVLPTENKHLSQKYIDNLNRLDPFTKERLLHGNWEYEDADSQLMQYNAIVNLFSNFYAATGYTFITADIARHGDDMTVIAVWQGWRCKVYSMEKKNTAEVSSYIRQLMFEHRCPLSNVVVDEDGVGGGVVDQLGCRGFINNSRPVELGKDEEYANLKTQCYYKLAEKVNNGLVYIEMLDPIIRSRIITEMEMVRIADPDKNRKKRIMSKAEIKQRIGHSPDYADAFMMRAYFEVQPMLSSI